MLSMRGYSNGRCPFFPCCRQSSDVQYFCEQLRQNTSVRCGVYRHGLLHGHSCTVPIHVHTALHLHAGDHRSGHVRSCRQCLCNDDSICRLHTNLYSSSADHAELMHLGFDTSHATGGHQIATIVAALRCVGLLNLYLRGCLSLMYACKSLAHFKTCDVHQGNLAEQMSVPACLAPVCLM